MIENFIKKQDPLNLIMIFLLLGLILYMLCKDKVEEMGDWKGDMERAEKKNSDNIKKNSINIGKNFFKVGGISNKFVKFDKDIKDIENNLRKNSGKFVNINKGLAENSGKITGIDSEFTRINNKLSTLSNTLDILTLNNRANFIEEHMSNGKPMQAELVQSDGNQMQSLVDSNGNQTQTAEEKEAENDRMWRERQAAEQQRAENVPE